MNGDRLILDRSGPGNTVSMRVVLAKDASKKNRSDRDGRDASTLRAPMPPARPTTLSDELRAIRLQRRVDLLHAEIHDHIVDYVLSRCDEMGSELVFVDEAGVFVGLNDHLLQTSRPT